MLIQITFRLTPTTRGELIDTYGRTYREFRQHIEALQQAGVLPPCSIRWLLDSGRWEGHPDPSQLPEMRSADAGVVLPFPPHSRVLEEVGDDG